MLQIKPRKPDTIATAQDPVDNREWLVALDAVVPSEDEPRARQLLQELERHARRHDMGRSPHPYSAHHNTIHVEYQPPYPGELEIEERLIAILRWNALARVVHANQAYGELGGYIASFASAAKTFEVGFQRFFRCAGWGRPGLFPTALGARRICARLRRRAPKRRKPGALSAGVGRPWPVVIPAPLADAGLLAVADRFDGAGAPGGGIPGELSAVLEAPQPRAGQRPARLGVVGDCEMDEPESVAGLTLAVRERQDNLTFIVNCNLQRPESPVRGNCQLIQELESLFSGAGCSVIKVLWGSDWDALFARDTEHALLQALSDTVDGSYQILGAKGGAYNIEHFFRLNPAVQRLVSHLSELEINTLKRGGHDLRKLHAAFAAAVAHKGLPTVILAKTKKGYGMRGAFESGMTAHQYNKQGLQALLAFRNRFALPLSAADVEALRFFKPADDSAEMQYLRRRRSVLDGAVPLRRTAAAGLAVPGAQAIGDFALKAAGKEMSTTMAAVRLLGAWLKAPELGPRVVPIVADEARTFGMASLLRQIGIYAPLGLLYLLEDAGSMLYYREARDSQLLDEGITEAGAISSWIAAATSYNEHGEPMLPVYIFYSMFGFQRVGDLISAATDQRSRGILLGATAGRTTLGGEGLQHQDGCSPVMTRMLPNCRAWDPAFAGEVAVILSHAAQRLMDEQCDEFHHVTVGNENYTQPSLPKAEHANVLRGLYRFSEFVAERADAQQVRLIGSGAILRAVLAASEILRDQWCVSSEVFSATSFSELERDMRRHNQYPNVPRRSHLQQMLPGAGPMVAATAYVRAWPQLIAENLDAPHSTLGTDGFGRSDTRERLRRFFEVDLLHIALAALQALHEHGAIDATTLQAAAARLDVNLAISPPLELLTQAVWPTYPPTTLRFGHAHEHR